MLNALLSYPGIKVIVWFLKNPESRIYVRALAKELGLNPATVSKYLKLFHSRGILLLERKGKLYEYYLNNSSALTRELKRLFIIDAINECGLLALDFVSVVLFGSCAKGTYTERSDVDILVIGENDVPFDVLKKIHQITGMEVNIHRFSLEEWLETREKPFGKRVREEGIILRGGEI